MQVFIHIGLPKTGTTFLQREVFPKLDVLYLNDSNDPANNPTRLFDHLRGIQLVERHVDETANSLSELIKNTLDQAGDNKNLLWSWEGLVGNHLLGNLNERAYADIIKKAVPNAKIIITLRRQSDFTESNYVQTIHNYSWGSPEDFILRDKNGNFSDFIFKSNRSNPVLSIKTLNWESLVDIYEQRFGKDNILVMPYELMNKDFNSFMAHFSAFLGCQLTEPVIHKMENRSFSRHSFLIARFLNRFVKRSGSPFGFIVNRPFCEQLLPHIHNNRAARLAYGILRRLDLRRILQEYIDKFYWRPNKAFKEELKQEILAWHKDSNKRLDEKYTAGLSDFGYY
jgi:hypothetical protein